MKDKPIPAGYNVFLKDIKQRIRTAQYEALKSVNKELILLYWDIGGKIVDSQKKHGWGKAIVETLAKDLQIEFPGVAGYSADNLWRMRKFYLNYANKPKLAPLVQEIAWAHNIIIMEKCKNYLSREFLVAIELKIGKFLPEYVGKMQFYLSALDAKVKEKSEAPSIGIILCKEKKRTIVEYALKESKKPIAVASYRITPTLPKELRKELPSPAQIQQLLAEI